MLRAEDVAEMNTESLKLKEIITENPAVIDVNATVSDAIALMRRRKVRELPVTDGGSVIGLVSYTSFVQRRSVPLTAKVDSIMLPCPRLDESTSIIDAAEALVSSGIRGAPVVRGDEMIGFVSRTDIIRAMQDDESLGKRRVDSFMTEDPETIGRKDTVHSAQVLMQGLNEKALPVVDDDDRIVGVIGMSEILKTLWSAKADQPSRSPKPPRKVFDSRTPAAVAVGSVMTRNVVTVTPEDTLGTVARVMTSKGLSTLFVVKDDRLVGVVDQADMMEQLIGLREREQVFVQISGLEVEDPDVYDSLYSLAGKGLRRINKMERPRVFNVHVTSYEKDGLTRKYSMRARLRTEKKLYYTSASDWDPYRTLATLLESMETSVRRERSKMLDRKTKTRSP
jgi:CBS domain-containing protein/ribosome-associated translation inhibitor RaiA